MLAIHGDLGVDPLDLSVEPRQALPGEVTEYVEMHERADAWCRRTLEILDVQDARRREPQAFPEWLPVLGSPGVKNGVPTPDSAAKMGS